MLFRIEVVYENFLCLKVDVIKNTFFAFISAMVVICLCVDGNLISIAFDRRSSSVSVLSSILHYWSVYRYWNLRVPLFITYYKKLVFLPRRCPEYGYSNQVKIHFIMFFYLKKSVVRLLYRMKLYLVSPLRVVYYMSSASE